MSGQAGQFAAIAWHVSLVGSRAFGIAIWIGVAMLSLALLVLMRTRWGQAQPLSKCVALSVFAHVLLFLYAYGTRLLEERPPITGDESIRLAFVATDVPPTDRQQSEAEDQVSDEPWDQLPAGELVYVPAETAERMLVPPESPSRVVPGLPEVPDEDVPPQTGPPDVQPERPTVTPAEAPAATFRQSPVRPVALEENVERSASEGVAIRPEPESPERVSMTTPDPRPSEESEESKDARLPSDLFAGGSTMQRLADIQARPEPADALVGAQDLSMQAENRDASVTDRAGRMPGTPSSPADSVLVSLPPRAPAGRSGDASPSSVVAHAVASGTRRLGDGQLLPEPYRLRTMPQRQELALALGSSVHAAAAVDAALAWLASAQESDGRWNASRWGGGIELRVAGHDRQGAGADADTGITGLAVLTFLANGQTHLEGTYRKNVQRGLEFLLRSQAPDGNLAGSARLYARMYCHGMASLALSESLGMTGDVRLTPYVERAVTFIVQSQHPTTGGWRYQPGDQGDMSQFGWQVMALKSAALAGIPIEQKTREGMLHFLQRCEHGRHGGRSGYRPGTPASRPMTAEALACRYFLDLAPDQALLAEACDYLLGELPQPGQPNCYYWYYGTLALFQVQGDAWSRWNEAMQHQLIRLQRTDGHLAGSWDPTTVWGCYGGRVYSTAMATLCLEVYYRYLPLTAFRTPGDGP